MTANAFELSHVSFAYLGRQAALIDVDMTVGKGEQLVVLGANGCGKSTLLKLMDGLLRPSSGTVLAFGEDASRAANDSAYARKLHQRVGLVFQDSDVQLFSPTVWDDVAFGPLQMGWSAKAVLERVDAALGMMEAAPLARRAPYELSEGEKKRVAIATVLALDPEVLLLDEPTASLDPRSKAVLLDLLSKLAEAGKTIVSTTQELEVAPSMGARAVVFGQRERRPIAEGDTENILADEGLLVEANLIHPSLRWRKRGTD